MRKTIVLLFVLLIPFFAFSLEGHLSVNYCPTFSTVNITLEGISGSSTSTLSAVEITGATYWGHSGIVYKFRFGHITEMNGKKIDNPEYGFNQLLGYSFITDISDDWDFVMDIMLLYVQDKASGYDSSDGYYTVDTYLLEVHGAFQVKYYISPVTTLNLGIDIGRPLYCEIEGGGAYAGESYVPTISGVRFAPFVGVGVKL